MRDRDVLRKYSTAARHGHGCPECEFPGTPLAGKRPDRAGDGIWPFSVPSPSWPAFPSSYPTLQSHRCSQLVRMNATIRISFMSSSMFF